MAQGSRSTLSRDAKPVFGGCYLSFRPCLVLRFLLLMLWLLWLLLLMLLMLMVVVVVW
jgi:hypothetical protein